MAMLSFFVSICRVNDTAKLKELIATARFARCRSRFVMPVILFENKVIVSVCERKGGWEGS